MAETLLEVSNLTAGFLTEDGLIKAADRVSFTLNRGETLCIVGESGSGKSVTSLAIMRLLEYSGGMILGGRIMFKGEDLTAMSQAEMRRIRGHKIAMIFQDPMTALNPVFTVGDQIMESLIIHQGLSRQEAQAEALRLLTLVGIPAPEIRIKQYPHELSGGMCQRIVIAIALACKPDLLIADEPTTALDVTVQAQILDLLRNLQRELGMSIILITHDMGVASEMADRIAVMYAGSIVEEGTVYDIFDHPSHPYTQGLLSSIPGYETERGAELYTIQGAIPRLSELPSGCRFHPRCPHVLEPCRTLEPKIYSIGTTHRTACWLHDHAAKAADN
ncbi:ABC transporter ATP-binding protein [Insulibacter thermoxylanivorax]|uniref:ABC transporter ATP-binding protein n=1 Tax=Insulibacter thermoxylanivorax TaxID=2749268 RepID=A0A916QGS5_9BACL|nr:ABC transporter ATP-binding protein [Insulibacter thermoxylanivorax]GFR38142.1 ABC transporter ATP-binding protein [Insulibacter thermoxylanivorax]